MQKFSILLLALIACAGTIFAERVQIGDLYYNLNADNKTAEVTYQEQWSLTNYSYLTAVNIPESVDYNSETYSVTSIGERAFYNCSGLTSIEISNSVTSIGDNAFAECYGLTSITIPNSVTSIGEDAFADCSGLTSVTIGNSVTSIGNYAFVGCKGLTSIEIPNSVTSIREYAFRNCSALTSMVVASGNTTYDSRENCNAIIETSTNMLIQGCQNTIIPNSVTGIGSDAFSYCTGLTSIEIPNSVTSIGSYAFAECYGLTSITIPNSVTSIGEDAFNGCTALTSIVIPNSVTSIGDEAFNSCSGLTSIVVASENTNYDSRDNCNAIIETSSNTLIAGCMNTIIPNSVISIGKYAFYHCTALTSITIPNSVTSIGDYAFNSCSGLTSITCHALTPPTCGTYSVFNRVDKSIPLYVPAESIEAYKAADQWKDFTNIQAIPGEQTIENPVQIGDLYYNLNAGNKTAEVTYQKKWSKTNYSYLTAINIPESVEYNSVTYTVTSIGEWAFLECYSLTSIEISNSVTSIGDEAFAYCSGLTSIEIPNSVTSIGNQAFRFCKGLTSIEIPNSVTSIGNTAFAGCSGLTSIEIPNSVTSIESGAFESCKGLTSIEIPNSVTSIGDYTFAYCSGLTSIEIPNSVTSIGDEAFSNVPNIVYNGSATGSPWGARSINGYVDGFLVYSDDTKTYLLACSSQATGTIEISNSVTSIGDAAFGGCTALTSITCHALTPPTCGYYVFGVDKSIPLYVPEGSVDLYKSAYGWKDFTNIQAIKCITASGTCGAEGDNLTWELSCDGVLTISGTGEMRHGSFWYYSPFKDVRHIILKEGVTDLCGAAFSEFWMLKSVEIPESLTMLKDSVFFLCSSLESIEIPSGMTSMGYQVFSGCSSLTSITCKAVTPPTLGFGVFDGVDKSIPLYVPGPSINLYKTADQWKDFTNILPIPGTEVPEYPVIFLNYNSDVLSEQSVAEGSAAVAPEVPEREGYIFKGWNVDIEHITDRTFVIALYDKEGIEVTYKAEDGETIFSEHADLHFPDAPSITGKTFAGWLTENVDKNGIVLRATYTTDKPTEDEDVSVVPGCTTAAVTFPFVTGAITYVLVIRDLFGSVVCKIMFNASGRLLGIAFAPNRERNQQQAQQTDGFSFTVEGLDPSTTYEYEFVANDEKDDVIETLTGSFTTTAEVLTDIQAPASDNRSSLKLIREDRVVILRDGKTYTVIGQEIR